MWAAFYLATGARPEWELLEHYGHNRIFKELRCVIKNSRESLSNYFDAGIYDCKVLNAKHKIFTECTLQSLQY